MRYGNCPTSQDDCEGQCPPFDCIYCGVNTLHIREYYMLHNELWQEVTALAGTNGSGMVCIECVEGQLGRNLTAADFTDIPLNKDGWVIGQSEMLRDRIATSH